MRIYISGPMTNYPDSNYKTFKYHEQLLIDNGHTPLSPANKPPATAGIPYKHCIDMDLAMLRASEAILLLKGHESSRGARFELAYAEILELKVFYEEDPEFLDSMKEEK